MSVLLDKVNRIESEMEEAARRDEQDFRLSELATDVLARMDEVNGRVTELERQIRALEGLRPRTVHEPDSEEECWECSLPVPKLQRRHGLAQYQAIICARCECWVRSVLQSEPKEDQA